MHPQRRSGAPGLPRRQLLRLALAGTAGAALGGCSQEPEPAVENPSTDEGGSPTVQPSTAPTRSTPAKVLVAYFSRPGEYYNNGGRIWLKVGNTEVVATMIAGLVPCDVYRIEAAEAYSDNYDDTVARNVREQNADARPAVANPLPGIDQYDVVLLGSPIWNVRAPMIMSTFTEKLDFTGKTVHPFTTYAMSGLGTTERDYARTCSGATVQSLAVRGEQAQQARPQVSDWLQRIGLR
jgi:flavodoxin